MIGRIRIELHLMVVHPKEVSSVMDDRGFRIDSDDVGDENGYGWMLGASYCLLFSFIKSLQFYSLLAL
jgi:hypothetical protein